MDKDKDYIEILLASYNGEKYLDEQIRSILAQSCDKWHLTVSDDGSTDSTEDILNSYIQQYPEKISRYYSLKKHGNPKDHFFELLKYCNANYIMFSDQDDFWFPNKVEVLLSKIKAEERKRGTDCPLLVFSDLIPTDENKKPIYSSLMAYQKQNSKAFDWRSILMQNVVTGGSMIINAALQKKAICCNDQSHIIMHDWWIAAVAGKTGEIAYIDIPLGYYRQHSNNVVGAKKVNSINYYLDSIFRIKILKNRIRQKKEQAQVFRQSFKSMFSTEEEQFLLGFEKKRSGLHFYYKNRQYIYSFHRLIGLMLLG